MRRWWTATACWPQAVWAHLLRDIPNGSALCVRHNDGGSTAGWFGQLALVPGIERHIKKPAPTTESKMTLAVNSYVQRYSPPATPCYRLFNCETDSVEPKEQLCEHCPGLDTVALLDTSR